mgnify:CR=1 FL=1
MGKKKLPCTSCTFVNEIEHIDRYCGPYPDLPDIVAETGACRFYATANDLAFYDEAESQAAWTFAYFVGGVVIGFVLGRWLS